MQKTKQIKEVNKKISIKATCPPKMSGTRAIKTLLEQTNENWHKSQSVLTIEAARGVDWIVRCSDIDIE